MTKVSLALIIHAHQPVGNFEQVFEETFQKAYAPFVRVLLSHPHIRASLHYSGILLEWLHEHHPEFFGQLRELLERRQVELIGGGYFEPILPAIPDADRGTQLRKLAGYLRDHFGVTPRGAWVAERVWEPSLVRSLVEAGVEYTVLDDTHFLGAGLELPELRGAYITEESGAPLRLVPSLKALRYAIPFREPDETLSVLREGIGQRGALFAMGDDCEKFGAWPGTFEHCYKNGWLEQFFSAIESARDWVETTTVSDFLAAHPPLGRVYLPAASYDEMMEWALPYQARRDFRACLDEAERLPSGERFRRFLRGGWWHNFLSKYSEANHLHKRMLEVSRRVREAEATASAHSNADDLRAVAAASDRRVTTVTAPVQFSSAAAAGSGDSPPGGMELFDQAQTHLLAAQCNDAYWHGVFGGLYAPHLRSALHRHLVQAESLLDELQGTNDEAPHVTSADFDVDGQEEILIQHSAFGAVLRPQDGGTISSLRFKPAGAELINSLMRRPEAYHDMVRHRLATTPGEGVASIHDRILSKESNLDALLRYDRYARHSFRTYVFPSAKRWNDFDELRLEESAELAGGLWQPTSKGESGSIELQRETLFRSQGIDVPLTARKTLTLTMARDNWEIGCRTWLSSARENPAALALGVEMVFNLLAPDAPDRYFLANEVRRPLEFRGEIESPDLVLVDEWQGVKIALHCHPHAVWWIAPIETVSQSEMGFERVYQGSAIMAVWRIDPPSWRDIACAVRVEVQSLSSEG